MVVECTQECLAQKLLQHMAYMYTEAIHASMLAAAQLRSCHML